MADIKISQLTADPAPTADDLIVTVSDPGGTPVNRKVTLSDLLDFIEANGAAPASFISSGTFANARISTGNVTQHQSALTITSSQISDLGAFITDITNENLGDLADVVIDTPANKEVLVYDTATTDWVNNTLAEAGISAVGHTHSASDITSGTFDNNRISQSNVTQHQAALSISAGQITGLSTGLTDVVNDTTPQLGGALDVNGQKIVSVSNGNIDIEPNGTGNVLIGNFAFDADQVVGPNEDNYLLGYEHSTGLVYLRPQTQAIVLALSDETTNLLVGTNAVTFRMPYAFRLTGVRASVGQAPTGAPVIVDVNLNGSSIFSTRITIDSGTKTSVGSAAPAVITSNLLSDDSEITVDIDGVGSTVAGKGLKVYLLGYPA